MVNRKLASIREIANIEQILDKEGSPAENIERISFTKSSRKASPFMAGITGLQFK